MWFNIGSVLFTEFKSVAASNYVNHCQPKSIAYTLNNILPIKPSGINTCEIFIKHLKVLNKLSSF